MVTNYVPRALEASLDQAIPASITGIEHHLEQIAGAPLHWVSVGSSGSPILLVHGFPETWWVFHRLIPLLATEHQVIAVDLPGFGDSDNQAEDYSSSAAAAALHELVEHLELGPVHLSGQDIGGNTAFRLATQYPGDVRSLTAIETLVSGLGFERLADVAHGGTWHVGAIATPGIAEFVFPGKVQEYFGQRWFPQMTRVAGAVTAADIQEFTRAYSRPGAWNGPYGLYSSALRDGDELASLASDGRLGVPVLAVDGMGIPSTAAGIAAASDDVAAVIFHDVGHHVALEAPERLADAMLTFIRDVDRAVRQALEAPAPRGSGE